MSMVFLFGITLFATVRYRNVGMASNTMSVVLSSIRVLMAWAQLNEIDFEDRFLSKRFLSQQEVESLCTYLQTKKSDLELQQNKIVRVTRRLERGPEQHHMQQIHESADLLNISVHPMLQTI